MIAAESIFAEIEKEDSENNGNYIKDSNTLHQQNWL